MKDIILKVEKKDPPYGIRQKVERYFDLSNVKPVFTFGDTIYNPFDGHIDDFLFAHEYTHKEQQGDDPHGWWDRYCTDAKFRLDQELQAYRVQYRVAASQIKDRNALNRLLVSYARDLSSPQYGNMCTQLEARTKIKDGV